MRVCVRLGAEGMVIGSSTPSAAGPPTHCAPRRGAPRDADRPRPIPVDKAVANRPCPSRESRPRPESVTLASSSVARRCSAVSPSWCRWISASSPGLLAKFGQAANHLGIVLLDRIEESVPRRKPRRRHETLQRAAAIRASRSATPLDRLHLAHAVKRFVMIADAGHERAGCRGKPAAAGGEAIRPAKDRRLSASVRHGGSLLLASEAQRQRPSKQAVDEGRRGRVRAEDDNQAEDEQDDAPAAPSSISCCTSASGRSPAQGSSSLLSLAS